MTISREDIFARISIILQDALGPDEDEITPEASLVRDLGAESIDFLDIVFQMEKAFGTADQPFKINQGELYPENLLDGPGLVEDGQVTEEGMAMLREHMPHVDLTDFDTHRTFADLAASITVDSVVNFVEAKLLRTTSTH